MASNVKIYNNSTFSKYKSYIFNGTNWTPYNANISNCDYEIIEKSGNLINITNGSNINELLDATIEIPYSSTAISSIQLTHCGKNLFDDGTIMARPSNNVKLAEHEYKGTSANMYSNYKAAVLGFYRMNFNWAERITVSVDYNSADGTKGGIEIGANYTSGSGTSPIGKTKYSGETYKHCSGATAAGRNIKHIYFSYGSSTDIYMKNFQFEVGAVETEFEPYNGTTITITFPESIYGGTLNLLTGELISTYDSGGELLATPVQLSVQPIKINFKPGINNFFCSALGNINLKYYVFNEAQTTLNEVSNRLLNISTFNSFRRIKELKINIPYHTDALTSIDFTHCGKNLFPISFPKNMIVGDPSSGTVTGTTYTKTFTIPCNSGSYTLSQTSRWGWGVGFSDKEYLALNDVITYKGNMNNRDKFIVSNDDNQDYLLIRVRDETYFSNAMNCGSMIEVGGTKTDFEPYNGNTYTITLPSDFYGGEIDLTAGKITSLYNNDGTLLDIPVVTSISIINPILKIGINNFYATDGSSISLKYYTLN